MINSITVTNHRNESLKIDLRNPWDTGLVVMSIDGLNPPPASINSTELSTTDGSVFNSARIAKRNIVLQFAIVGIPDAENNRHKLYQYFPIKHEVTLEIDSDYRRVYARGYVESNDTAIFNSQVTAQISLVCMDPYFYSIDETVTYLIGTTGGFEFPFSNPVGDYTLKFADFTEIEPKHIVYPGEIPVGVTITIYAYDTLGDLRFYNLTYEQEMILEAAKIEEKTGSPITSGDIVTINTIVGQKSIELKRGGSTYNILSSLPRNTKWIQLETGLNTIIFSGSGLANSQVLLSNRIAYEGA